MNKRIISVLILYLIFNLPLFASNYEDELFVVITTEDAETQMMALVLATQSFNQEVPVRILLCSHAGDLAIAHTESVIFEPAGRSPKQLLQNMLNEGVLVEVCGIYLPNRNVDKSDLMEGIGVASPPEVARFMKQEGIRYFTF